MPVSVAYSRWLLAWFDTIEKEKKMDLIRDHMELIMPNRSEEFDLVSR